MSEDPIPQTQVLAEDDKIVSVMAYTPYALCWGDVIVKQIVRVSTWLRSGNAPDNIRLFNARVLYATGASIVKPIASKEIFINASEILAFHIRPPASEPLDYDPEEPNRRMEPVMILIGNFRIDGFLRISTRADLAKFIEVNREMFTSVYDAEISCPIISTIGITRVPYLVVRQGSAIFSVRS